ncbi:hypothetical protein HF888_08440 [Bermanella marisrubri]|uniref:Signal-transducing histidine kinase n=1 Tax=Bermanella marisrubri TaxID=207949 RepID=Q1MXU5_9GAMM|nr:CHASE4 domain-containing protein [Bermanella marisrubri]EAT10792.1 signal-transducing histidine kinase [Oceanobacter sp. RED65] [Bermanella marisrubri]QIZ84254.1 hypothetical protein HF888_08440 [Bermanella marisrubri]
MHLRALVFIAAITYAMVIGGGLVLYRMYVVIPELQHSTIINHQNKLKAIHSSYLNDLRNLEVLNIDWAAWNDTFFYIDGRNEHYLSENILPYAFEDLHLDLVVVIARDKTPHFIGIQTSDGLKQLDSIEQATQDLDIDFLLSEQQQTGTLRIDGAIGYYTSHAVTDNFEEEPSNGILLFARKFPDSLFQRIKLLTQTQVKPISVESITTDGSHIINPMTGFAISTLNKDYYLLLDEPNNPFQSAFKVTHESIDVPFILDETTIFSILHS